MADQETVYKKKEFDEDLNIWGNFPNSFAGRSGNRFSKGRNCYEYTVYQPSFWSFILNTLLELHTPVTVSELTGTINRRYDHVTALQKAVSRYGKAFSHGFYQDHF